MRINALRLHHESCFRLCPPFDDGDGDDDDDGGGDDGGSGDDMVMMVVVVVVTCQRMDVLDQLFSRGHGTVD